MYGLTHVKGFSIVTLLYSAISVHVAAMTDDSVERRSVFHTCRCRKQCWSSHATTAEHDKLNIVERVVAFKVTTYTMQLCWTNTRH